jgi:hypothetical protein
VVLQADPALLISRQVAEPMLHAGNGLAARASTAGPNGVVVAVVLAPFAFDKDPIWFGTPRLPEEVRPPDVRRERAAAEAAGIAPFDPAAVTAALLAGGPPIEGLDERDLAPALAELRKRYVDENTP